jgi:hypothetical protein
VRRVSLFVNGMNVRDEEIQGGTKAGVKWEAAWRLPRPSHDVYLVAIAQGPGVTAPYWPGAKPYQPTSIHFTPYVMGISGAVFVDADGSETFESAHEYARREVSASDGKRSLETRLGSYDSAVSTQAASLLRAQDPSGFERRIRSMIKVAPAQVANGLTAYLKDWKGHQ